ncbi:esterase-like activity of phytase family protein [Brevundimonas vesicularis]|uniref:esterase-like activity of phytase family protein n=1 Tax=Brevundimonas vesicularis TaxID=41276 RepID=UPI0038D37D96
MNRKIYLSALAGLMLAACAGAVVTSQPWLGTPGHEDWSSETVSTRTVGLGLPGGAVLAEGVSFEGGIEVLTGTQSPIRSLSDLKLTGDGGFVSVSDVGDLVRGRLRLDANGELVGLDAVRVRRLTLQDGQPISDKVDGDAEGLAILPDGELLVSFERNHRIWNYGPLEALAAPRPVPSPDFAFGDNDGMEALATAQGGWRVAGESGGVWDCNMVQCNEVVAPPATPLVDADYRLTGMDVDPAGGWFVVTRSFTSPINARVQVRRLAADGKMGPALVTLKLPGTTDNFEGIAVERRGERTRLYILSDDNFNALQRTLMLAFDVAD